MGRKPTGSLERHFGGLKDPRHGNAMRRKFIEILIIRPPELSAKIVLSGRGSWSAGPMGPC